MVFIDYQNAYKSARRAFFDDEWDASVCGQFHPLRLALKLKGLVDSDRELVGVRVYRGIPSESRNQAAAAATDRQIGIIPALEAVAELKGPEACESATWPPDNDGKKARPLLLPHQKLGNVHMMSRKDFGHVADSTDYNIKRRRR
jgi:hypothetical protein